ncbi:rRNA N6-adenosine-methyltransferase METTL5-like [Daktulosphaira vitifoliae]|uniref:rRNA N6-adenosine-methyltransferase METTL5-like n=1 Tax=Daktulosphaira vitifoliae TaxID=58002 RepID=UPI0021AACE2F|nr:rRNA N6-adenosine-methyltransferase METTL5-like [Daktulosphaira vitifoliae]XP_050539256.1 rRNA N6-adenosine-methyltransferase METTL5-like [Daktulosphaira vitifoliae]XP_050539257.1 rRNA N6-adenosine-methyltransferase METTL5-like [Daktulosphaira vitifoliae]XP_050539258.1 rRNA N6-adenosine-methyltransferase METTL5-like [Daktulosphaira vitifoliae]XP_050548080.1 rRNA N6-adenosine-methyltransferase METTL5-like [Daktulosphaira vitifoliae]XP_050548081.1 rRNA N6-adenosine-methyltransferase METTL5-li
MACMKLKKLQFALEDIETFVNPKIELEQYTTSSHIAACILHTAQFVYGDISEKSIADLGCGSGVLCIGAALLGANYCTGFDIDPSALELSVENTADRDLSDRCDFILCNVKNIKHIIQAKSFDTVIMNPPFGTRDKGADVMFLNMAIHLARTAVYSLHKKSTRDHIINEAKKWGIYSKVIAELRFDLPASYKFHKQSSVDIEVDLIRFTMKPTE